MTVMEQLEKMFEETESSKDDVIAVINALNNHSIPGMLAILGTALDYVERVVPAFDTVECLTTLLESSKLMHEMGV